MKITAIRTAITAVIAAAVALITAGVTDSTSTATEAGVTAAVVLVAVTMVAPGGRSVIDRLARRRRFRRPIRTKTMLYSTSQNGTVWDGEAGIMYVALKPRPFQVSVIDRPDDQLKPVAVPTELIVKHLYRSDIHVSEINILSAGFRRYAQSDFDSAYRTDVGDTPIPPILNTVIETKVDLARSLQSVQARAVDGSTPTAVGRAAFVSARRLEQELNVEGYEARVLRMGQIAAFNSSVLASVNDGLKREGWSSLGGPAPAVFTRPAEWTSRAAEKWYRVPADRMMSAITLRPERFGRASVGMAIGYAFKDAPTMSAKALGLKRIGGGQGDAATLMLPGAKTIDPGLQELNADGEDWKMPISVPAAGLGLLLGAGLSGGRCFLNVQTGGEILYLQAPEEFLVRLIGRMTSAGASVGIHLEGEHWSKVAKTINPHLIIAGHAAQRERARRFVEIHPDSYRDHPHLDTAVIVWCPLGIPEQATYQMVINPDGSGHIRTPAAATGFLWPLENETRWLIERNLTAVSVGVR